MADTVNLENLMVQAFNMKVAETPFHDAKDRPSLPSFRSFPAGRRTDRRTAGTLDNLLVSCNLAYFETAIHFPLGHPDRQLLKPWGVFQGFTIDL